MAFSELVSIAVSNGVAVLLAVVKHAAYPFKVDENIKALDSAVSELKAMKNDVLRVKESTDSTNHIFPSSTVQDWLIKVNKVIEEADAIDQKYKERHWFVHVISSDYNISRHAAKKLPEVKSLIANEVIRSVITGTHLPAASPQPAAGVEFNVKGRRFAFQYLGKK